MCAPASFACFVLPLRSAVLLACRRTNRHKCTSANRARLRSQLRASVSTNIWSNCNPCKRYLRSPAVAGVVVVVVVEEEELRT